MRTTSCSPTTCGVRLPVVADGTAPEHTYDDANVVRLVSSGDDDPVELLADAPPRHPDSIAAEQPGPADPDPEEQLGDSGSLVTVSGTLGAQLLLWEVATAVAGRLLDINPFDQPDVESAKEAARGLLDQAGATTEEAAFVDGSVEVRSLGGDWLGDAHTVPGAVSALLSQLDDSAGYVAVMAYLDRLRYADLAAARRALAVRTKRPVTFGWGPRFLHSTGQLHKGGPPVGVYLQVTATPDEDLPIPGSGFGFGTLIAAQAAGDAAVLADHGRPVLRLHIDDVTAGVAILRDVIGR